ncbi:DUF4139 domain-containing protein [Psychrobacter sp. CAM01]|uniref:DUF4139 domain-containing protein n=1 Tax=Psychrobacter sp. CAM01 TaxID=3080335 RepID=UPI002935A0C8|nr:DUF4139 domain-containing protein [Psychrobacter sp. CAM01]MDV2859370.1 DUF4139 domain-containing protein [Psychrobacter sp. CAM01]
MQADVSKVEAATEYRWAKKGPILLSLPSLLALSLTPAYAASSSIEQVTIYQGLASVTRALPVKGNGEQTLVFSCLSPYIDKDSVSVQAVTGVNLGEVSIETLSGEQAAQCQYEGDANVQSQQAALAKINAELEAANLAKAYLQNLTKVSQLSTEGTVANNARDIETQAASINKRIWDIKQRQARAQAALNQTMAGSSTSTQSRVTQVSVRTASRKPAAVKLHYQVRGAGWQPTYQARLDTNTEQLSITASAIIAQQTGENWQNVPVVLSSVNPNQRTTGQLPNVARLSLYEKEPASRARVASSMMEPAPIVVSERSGDDRKAAAPTTASLPSFSVSRQNKNGIIEYRLPQRVSLPSDGRHVRTVIDEQSGRSKLWIRSTPSVEQTAYWYASAPFLTPAWAEGALQLYRDDNYIGQARYQYQTLKEQGIGFGVDPNILIKQITDEDKQGDKGAFNRKQTLSRTQAYQLTNQHSRTRRLQVLGSEPISRDDSLKVTTVHTPPVTERDWNDNTGMVAWEFDLPSKQSKVIQSTTQISYPADKKLRTN